MPKKTGVDPAVVAAVKAWAAERDLDRSALVLAEHRRALDPTLVPVLVAEVAEVTAELLVELLDLPPRDPQRGEPVDVLGMSLHPDQIERFQCWIEDQGPTAKALGLELEAWTRRVEEGFLRTLDALKGRAPGTGETAGATAARGLLAQVTGAQTGTFSGGVDPSKSEKAGLRGLLALRDFGKDAKKK